MSTSTEVRGGVALVTGAARRIGAAIAGALHRRGLSVAVHYRTSRDDAQALARALERLNEELESRFPGVAALGWPVLAHDYLALMESKSSSNGLLLFLVFLIAAVGISNTMLIAVYERIREFGMMRALGMDDAAIRAAMVIEAGIIGLLGSLTGLVLGAAATFWLVNWGLDMSGLYGATSIGYRVAGVFRGAWNPGIMVTSVVFGVLASMAIALLPARRALRLDVVQCLRHE